MKEKKKKKKRSLEPGAGRFLLPFNPKTNKANSNLHHFFRRKLEDRHQRRLHVVPTLIFSPYFPPRIAIA